MPTDIFYEPAYLFVVLPVQLLLVWCIYKEMQELWERKKRKQRSMDNLLGEQLELTLSAEDADKMFDLMKLDRTTSGREFIRAGILRATEEGEIE